MAKTPPRPPASMKVPRYASYVEGRTPKWKMHTALGLAKNAVLMSIYGTPRGGAVYENVRGDWQLVFQYEQDWDCVICGENIVLGGRRDWRVANPRANREQCRIVHYNPRAQFGREEQHPCFVQLQAQEFED